MRNSMAVAITLALVVTAGLGAVDLAHADGSEIDARLVDSATYWVNQGGSVMALSFYCEGSQPNVCRVSGHYINHQSGFNCQGTPYPLSGVYYINTQTISWSVAWSNPHEDCGSVTGWTGYFDLSMSPIRLVTNWNLAYSTGGSGRTIMQGQDLFTQSSTVSSESLIEEPESQ